MTGSAKLKPLLGLVLVVVAAVPLASLAADVRPVFKAGYDTGGDKIVTAVFTSGSTKSIKANEGIYIGGGTSAVAPRSSWTRRISR